MVSSILGEVGAPSVQGRDGGCVAASGAAVGDDGTVSEVKEQLLVLGEQNLMSFFPSRANCVMLREERGEPQSLALSVPGLVCEDLTLTCCGYVV